MVCLSCMLQMYHMGQKIFTIPNTVRKFGEIYIQALKIGKHAVWLDEISILVHTNSNFVTTAYAWIHQDIPKAMLRNGIYISCILYTSHSFCDIGAGCY